jgi:hypothetical protein
VSNAYYFYFLGRREDEAATMAEALCEWGLAGIEALHARWACS